MKGFQIAKGEYVLFDKDELDAVKLESTRILWVDEASLLVPSAFGAVSTFDLKEGYVDGKVCGEEHGADRESMTSKRVAAEKAARRHPAVAVATLAELERQ